MAIKNVQVPEDQITYDSAVVTWETDAGEENTEDGVRYGVGSPGTDTGEAPNVNLTTFHSVTVGGLQPGTLYLFQPHSRLAGSRSELGYADANGGIVPGKTLVKPASGQVTGLSIQADSTDIISGSAATLTIRATGAGGSVAGKGLSYAITNAEPGGLPRGTFDPAEPVIGPDPDNVTVIRFTGGHNGKAKIQIQADNVGAKVDINVRP